MMPVLVMQECVLALPAECEEQQMKREEIEKLIDQKLREAGVGAQAAPLSGGGGPTNPTQPGGPKPQ